MSGLEKIIDRLNRECDEQCEAIIAAAEEKAAEITSRAQTEGNETIKKYEEDAQKQEQALIMRAGSSGELEARKNLLQVKTELVDKVISGAGEMIKNSEAAEYFDVMLGLAEKNAQPGTGVMFFGAKDLSRLPAGFSGRLPEGIVLSDKAADISDGFILKYGDIEINCSVDALFSSARDELKLKASQLLF